MRGGERETTSGDAFGSAGTHHHGWNGLEGEESDSTQEDVVHSNGMHHCGTDWSKEERVTIHI